MGILQQSQETDLGVELELQEVESNSGFLKFLRHTI